MSPNLISRSFPRFLIFHFIFSLSFMSSSDNLFYRILGLFSTSHSFSLLSTQIYLKSVLMGNIGYIINGEKNRFGCGSIFFKCLLKEKAKPADQVWDKSLEEEANEI